MPFDQSKVPDGPAADWFYNGETGEGILDEEYDETKRRFLVYGEQLPWEQKEATS